MKISRLAWAGLALVAGSVVLAAVFNPMLPDPVPTHWNMSGQANGWTAKPWGVWMMPLITGGLWLISLILPVISPKGYRLDSARRAYDIVWFVLIAFMLAVQLTTYMTSLGRGPGMTPVITIMTGVLFIVLGNYLGKFPKNFFVGIRTPWTLASDEVWNRTHRLAGWTFMAAGVVVVISAFMSPEMWVFAATIAIAALIPLVYSFVLYKKLHGFDERAD